ncbi:MAG: hypothetical protein JRH01_03280 [Deltaproteobacteria bacterium]|nr:hypothetical protein [Deltaproteobacteria bacterium]MBW2394491.1 hypothetical protein [Deltaproteobacteria bacterium]
MDRFPQRIRLLVVFLGLALVLPAGTALAADPVSDVAGIYDLVGETVIGETGVRFVMTGSLVVRQKGENLAISTEASVKRVEGKAGPASLKFITRGDAILEGNRIEGAFEVQTIVGLVPGVDVSVPGMTKKTVPVFIADASGFVVEEGKLHFVLTSSTEVFGPGAERRTTIDAVRVARKATELKKKKK